VGTVGPEGPGDPGARRVQADARPDHIDALVVLTDGYVVDSRRTAQDVIHQLDQRSDSQRRARVFTIAYYPGTTASIVSVYRSIASFF
jgi:hypothetical protein